MFVGETQVKIKFNQKTTTLNLTGTNPTLYIENKVMGVTSYPLMIDPTNPLNAFYVTNGTEFPVQGWYNLQVICTFPGPQTLKSEIRNLEVFAPIA